MVLWGVLFLGLGFGIARANSALEPLDRADTASGDIEALPDGRTLRILSLGFERVVADLFWIRTAYYLGDEASYQAGYPAADRLAELVTDIDPEFRTVYVMMGSGLSVLQGNPRAAVRLLEKGIQHIEYWKLHFILGFTYFFELLDYERAAHQMALASGLEGGPAYLAPFAARLYHEAGDPETAIALIQARLREETHEPYRVALEKRFWDLWINRDLENLNRAIAEFEKKEGSAPPNLEALLAAGLIDELPRDPEGNPYSLEGGKATTHLEYEELEVFLGSGAGAHLEREKLERERKAP